MLIGVIAFGFTTCGDLFGDKTNDDNSDKDNSNSSTAYAWYGDGSSSSFTIRNITQLQEFANVVSGSPSASPRHSDFKGKTVTLASDIDMSGIESWAAIGTWLLQNKPFNGTFDGNNKTISGLNAARGLFWNIDVDGTVKNLTIVGLKGASGGLSERNGGRIQNISITGSAKDGGVVGVNRGIVENCNFSGTVSSTYTCGGIAGLNGAEGVVRNCYVTGSVTAQTGTGVGGIVGDNYGTVENCYSICTVTSTSTTVGGEVGGIAGRHWNGTIKNCYATGNIRGYYWVGGIVGRNLQNNTIQNCVALNSSIIETTTDYASSGSIGRVAGGGNGGSHSNNFGLNGMSIQGNGSVTVTSDASGKHGADVSTEEAATQSWWTTTVNWDFSTVWEWDSTRNLPKLR
jgi:hypothetical protein